MALASISIDSMTPGAVSHDEASTADLRPAAGRHPSHVGPETAMDAPFPGFQFLHWPWDGQFSPLQPLLPLGLPLLEPSPMSESPLGNRSGPPAATRATLAGHSAAM